jgi:hypothetical protein
VGPSTPGRGARRRRRFCMDLSRAPPAKVGHYPLLTATRVRNVASKYRLQHGTSCSHQGVLLYCTGSRAVWCCVVYPSRDDVAGSTYCGPAGLTSPFPSRLISRDVSRALSNLCGYQLPHLAHLVLKATIAYHAIPPRDLPLRIYLLFFHPPTNPAFLFDIKTSLSLLFYFS